MDFEINTFVTCWLEFPIIIIWHGQHELLRDAGWNLKCGLHVFEATSCQDEPATETTSCCAPQRRHLRWALLVQMRSGGQKGTVWEGFTTAGFASSVSSDSTGQGQVFPEHCRTHPFLGTSGNEIAGWRGEGWTGVWGVWTTQKHWAFKLLDLLVGTSWWWKLYGYA